MSKLNNKIITEEINKLYNIQKEIEYFFNGNKFIDMYDINEYKKNLKLDMLKLQFTINIFLIIKYKKYKEIYGETIGISNSIISRVNNHNNDYLRKQKELFDWVCGRVEKKKLDYEQIDAIVRENKNQLVVAGAGCGKTTTIVGKVKYLVKVLGIKPEEILLLSFTNKSAADMKRRVESEIGTEMECNTFHKLGLDICKEKLSGFAVYEGNMTYLIQDKIKELTHDEKYANKLLYFFTENIYLLKDEYRYLSEDKQKKYLENDNFITIDGKEVKSFGELEIANFLFRNGVKYEYELPYKYSTKTEEYKQYQPDFYLPDYDIYIEYFGIDKDNNVPEYFTSKHGKDPKQEYLEGILWKRKLHKENNTKLIELYYYENKKGILKSKLEKELLKNNIELNPMSDIEVFEYIENKNSGILYNIANSFEQVINLIKSNNYKIDALKEQALSEKYAENIITTLELVEPIMDLYDDYLAKNRYIDFNEMINLAIDACKSGEYIHNYKYVIVDEFQDISISRYNLLKSMRDISDYKLFCVGDDFQSIYRFGGSDIGIFTNFEKYFGWVQINKIEKTHRFTDNLSKISGEFIMKNPNQMPKKLKGVYSDVFPMMEIEGYTSKAALSFLEQRLNLLEENSEILFLGRYNSDNRVIIENKDFIIKKEKIIYKKRPDLKIKFMTIHKSKGLEADYVVLLNTRKKFMGFPSKIMDLPIINFLLDNSDDYPYSEERRLFYVAMTRAKKKVFFLVEEKNKSQFLYELEYKYSNEFEQEKYKCPNCNNKLLFLKQNDKQIIKCGNEQCNNKIKNAKEQLNLFDI